MRIGFAFSAFLLLSLGWNFSSLAQDDIVNITRTYEPTISEARKPDFRPTIQDTLQVQPSFDYRIVPVQLSMSFRPEPIRAAKLIPSREEYRYGNFIRLGFGTNISPLVDVRLFHTYKRSWKLGLEAKHESAFPKFSLNDKDYYPHFNRSELKMTGTRFHHRNQIRTEIGFVSEGAPFYGFDFDSGIIPAFDSLSNRQVSVLNAAAQFKSLNLSRNYFKIDYDFDYYFLFDNAETREHGVSLGAMATKGLRSYDLNLPLKLELFHWTNPDSTRTNVNIRFNPFVSKEKDEWKAILGLNSATKLDANDEWRFFIYPNLQFEFALAEEYLHSYFGFTGEMKDNFFFSTYSDNPFVSGSYWLKPTEIRKNIFVGVRGLITSQLKYHVKASYLEYRDLMLYRGEWNTMNTYQFQPLYTNADRFNGLLEVTYSFKNDLQVGLVLNYDQYFSFSQPQEFPNSAIESPYFIPNWNGNLFARYDYNQYLSFSTDFTFLSNRTALNLSTYDPLGMPILPIFMEENLGEVYQWNLGVDYKYNSKVTAFLKLENLLGQKYWIYDNYPSQGFRARIGVSYFF